MALFDKNKVAKVAKPAKASGDNITIRQDMLDEYAALVAAEKAIEGAKKTIEERIKGDAIAIFIARGDEINKRPDNIKASDDQSEASIQLRNRSSRSVLTDEDVKRLEDAGVRVGTVNRVTETFIVNPVHVANEDLMGRVEAALAGIVPNDFFAYQTEVTRVADGDTLDDIFKLKTPQITALLPLACSIAIRATTKMSMSDCLDVVLDIVDPQEDGEGE